ncbi:spore coat protein [Paenibacillus yanchengensis]|uniref:Spore coat protein n=1 Tax=Paenibacillus yanchengensis TaxID=2035833 RepID=A0ABW4YM13_9BACL
MNNRTVSLLSDEDLASTVLCDLKRVVREYATAATESTCPQVRQMFTDLLNKTLTAQGQMFEVMKNAQMYELGTSALQTDINKQIQCYTQTQQGTNEWLSNVHGQAGQFAQSNTANTDQQMNNMMQ